MQLIAIFIFSAIIIACSAEKESEGTRQRRGRRGKEEQNGWSTKKVLSSRRRQGQREGAEEKKSLLMRNGAVLDESMTTAGRKIFHHYQSSLMDWGTGKWQRRILMAGGKKITRFWQWWVYEEGSLRWQWRLLNATQHNSGFCAGNTKTTSSTIVSRTYLHHNCCSSLPDTQNGSISASQREAPLAARKTNVVSAFCRICFRPKLLLLHKQREEDLGLEEDKAICVFLLKNLIQKRIWATRREKQKHKKGFFFSHILISSLEWKFCE